MYIYFLIDRLYLDLSIGCIWRQYWKGMVTYHDHPTTTRNFLHSVAAIALNAYHGGEVGVGNHRPSRNPEFDREHHGAHAMPSDAELRSSAEPRIQTSQQWEHQMLSQAA